MRRTTRNGNGDGYVWFPDVRVVLNKDFQLMCVVSDKIVPLPVVILHPDCTLSESGLLRSHRTKDGTWARIVVLEGALTYRILEPAIEEMVLTPERHGVVEPMIRHEVVPGPGVRFYVEFYGVERGRK
jgi:tellurite resistance-related uncharacterized protein